MDWQFFAYGFGELIDKATEIEKNIHVHSDEPKVDIIKEAQQKDTNNQPQESHNIKSSNMPFGDFGKVEYKKMENAHPSTNEKWFCPECARENDNSVKTCKCGHQQDDNV